MSTASSLEITLKSKIPCRRLVMPATPVAVPDDTEVVPPKSKKRISQRSRTTRRSSLPNAQKRISQRYRTTRRSSLPNARSEYRSGTGRHGGHPSQMPRSKCRSGTGRHGGHPSQMPEANIAAVPDDTEVIPPKCQKRISQRYRTTRRSSLPNAQKQMPQRYRTTRRSSLPNARSEYRSERVDLAISSHCMILASIRTPSRYQVYSTV